MNIKELVKFSKTLKVLYVEDNLEARESIILMLNNFFDDITIAVDGDDGYEEYIKYHENNNKYFDLVISDISMPKMDGTEMCKLIFMQNKQQPVLIISAHNESKRLEELINMGVSNFVHKPIQQQKFTSILEDILNDIQNVKNKENELNEIEKLNNELDVLVDSFDTYVIASRTDLSGKITYASKAYEIISGYEEAELLGKPHNIVRHPDMPSSAFKDMWNTIQDGKLWTGEVKNLKKDGSYYWVYANIAPYYDVDKNHVGYSAIRIDITAQKEVEKLHSEVNNLLNSAGQGFLSFGKSLSIDESFSKECSNIFEIEDIKNKNIADLLFTKDRVKKELFIDGINRTFDFEDETTKEIFLSLLPKEHILNGKTLTIEYKLLPNNKFMLVLTDITNTKKLQKQIEKQNQIQRMIVAVASNQNDFIEIKLDFENFISNPTQDLKILLRELHTFKGIFAQKEMVHIAYGIHELESKINEISKEADIQTIIKLFHTHDLQTIFDIDLEIIASTLGDEFLNASCSLNVDIDSLDSLETKIKQFELETTKEALKDILGDIEKIRNESIYHMLNIYPTAVKQMAHKLQKEVYPLEILGDKDLRVNAKFKPFIKSLIHLFNNCVEHGIEDIETRVEYDKDEIGSIGCEFKKEGNNLHLIINDDGAGIDIEKLSESAIKNGVKFQGEKLMLVFADSISTTKELSTTSGRGIGMSAIKSEVDKLGGNIKIKNAIGHGVKFIFTLPL